LTSLLSASNKYECLDLKLYVESLLTEEHLTKDSALKLLAFADGHSCALLKEAAMKLSTDGAKEMRASKDWNLIIESENLKDEFYLYHDEGCSSSNGAEFVTMTVSELRLRLEKASLELDGDRKTHIDRLNEHHSTKMGEISSPIMT
jgi:hypothetical protein